MGISFVDDAYNRAQGTRAAFNGLSDDLVREGHPAMVSLSGDREPEVQERLWYERMTLKPGSRKVYGYRFWNGQKWFQIHPDTVAPPGTGNHVARRSNDLKWPYNSDTVAARRAKVLARNHNITREGENFRELWHWTFWGSLGVIDNPSSGGGQVPAEPEKILEDTMSSNPIINVVPKNGDHASNGTIHIGLDDGSFEPLRPPFATNIRGIISVGLLGSDSGSKDTIPTLSQDDFNALKAVWATMCKGRTDAAAVWAEGVHAQDAEGRGLYIDAAGKITTTPTGKPLKFTAAGFLASTNALANDAADERS